MSYMKVRWVVINKLETIMPVTMFSVESSTIISIGYSEEKKELHIIFNGSHEYVYRDVPADLWQQFREAESVGRFFAQNIKKKFTGVRQS